MATLWRDTFTDLDGVELPAHIPDIGAGYTLVSGVGPNGVIQSNQLIMPVVGVNTIGVTLDGMDQVDLTQVMTLRREGDGNVTVVMDWRRAPDNSRIELWLESAGSSGTMTLYGLASPNYFEAAVPFTWAEATDIVLSVRLSGRTVVIALDGVVLINTGIPFDFSGTSSRVKFDRTATGTLIVDDLFLTSLQEQPMINLRTGQWNMHREGVALLLAAAGQALCAGTGMPLTGEVRLWTSPNSPGCNDAVADYTEALFSGYAPVVITPGPTGCDGILEIGVDDQDIGQIVIDQQTWTEADPATVAETINGAYLVLIDALAGEHLLATFEFPTAVPMASPGDILKVAGWALLDCQMVPVA